MKETEEVMTQDNPKKPSLRRFFLPNVTRMSDDNVLLVKKDGINSVITHSIKNGISIAGRDICTDYLGAALERVYLETGVRFIDYLDADSVLIVHLSLLKDFNKWIIEGLLSRLEDEEFAEYKSVYAEILCSTDSD
ncbi:hypothetical protein Cyrtocomes_00785 [Candidatus Cyrtobacter comes]|uniref:Uncharacterized protein n=1 Tax=Candidatus Cyrtobacter comes TaxID=675776 RepID=A0ABU5L8G5_9RICK|nr:hypothetical protein [Candidatus Cyrtobacter comes]MDZ5762405.1 hypothetical protein [Candidatus Cyrtobacter comes]